MKYQTQISDEEIFNIIEKKGVFKVLRYHYRAYKIRRRCNKLKDRGLLKFAGIKGDQLCFISTETK